MSLGRYEVPPLATVATTLHICSGVVSTWPWPIDVYAVSDSVQTVPEAKVGKNRAHVDMYVDDLDAATTRVEELGGRWTDKTTLFDGAWVSRIMADPEGNEFCMCLTPSNAKQWRAAPDEVVVRNEGRSVHTEVQA